MDTIRNNTVPLSYAAFLAITEVANDSSTENYKINLFNNSAAMPAWQHYGVSEKYYYEKLGFFCRKEWQIQKAVKLPVYFRLGSVEYTDRMEGKRK